MRLTSIVGALLLASLSMASVHAMEASQASASAHTSGSRSWSISASSFAAGKDGNIDANGNSQAYMSMAPRFEYFVSRKVAVGLQTNVQTNFASTTQLNFVGSATSVGPVATYHFWNRGSFAANTSAALVFNGLLNLKKPSNGALTAAIGANYEFAPWFAMGPRLSVAVNSSSIGSLNAELINLFFYL